MEICWWLNEDVSFEYVWLFNWYIVGGLVCRMSMENWGEILG